MTFKQSIQICFSKYVTFTGRATRSEFWWFYLFIVIIEPILLALGRIFAFAHFLQWIFNALASVSGLVLILPSLAVSIRRLHDTGRSGWNLFWSLLPVVGWIILLVFWIQDSK